ncbi:MAG: ROK family protein [Alphaproteobacteria bacterium]|nr:ROK family protein [Alphaproteobacteria bacterium]
MRLGIDLGGTKIEILALGDDGRELLRERTPTPRATYDDTLAAIARLVQETEQKLGQKGSLGVGIPGAISPQTGLVKNANSTHLIGHALDRDLGNALNRTVRVANDANCFALSEASDGAGAGKAVVFGVILGTGVGGGVCINGSVLTGAHAIAGEWGHNPLPMREPGELPAPNCYCGRANCIEAWCSGPALEAQFQRHAGHKQAAAEIERAAKNGDTIAQSVLNAHSDRLARALATVVNLIDPDAIVLGGGLSNMTHLYEVLPPLVERYAFKPEGQSLIVKNRHGDSSGVRGAAWLWTLDDYRQGLPG